MILRVKNPQINITLHIQKLYLVTNPTAYTNFTFFKYTRNSYLTKMKFLSEKEILIKTAT